MGILVRSIPPLFVVQDALSAESEENGVLFLQFAATSSEASVQIWTTFTRSQTMYWEQ